MILHVSSFVVKFVTVTKSKVEILPVIFMVYYSLLLANARYLHAVLSHTRADYGSILCYKRRAYCLGFIGIARTYAQHGTLPLPTYLLKRVYKHKACLDKTDHFLNLPWLSHN
jgi:hypothetical protein